jgi:hypothetical protein
MVKNNGTTHNTTVSRQNRVTPAPPANEKMAAAPSQLSIALEFISVLLKVCFFIKKLYSDSISENVLGSAGPAFYFINAKQQWFQVPVIFIWNQTVWLVP